MMKEKSKNAAKTRREKEKVEFQELARLLPLPDAISGQLDKASVIRLATAFLRLRRLLLENESSTLQSRQQTPFQSQQSVPSTPTMSYPNQCHKSLTDTSNTGFVQPKLPASTPPPCSTPFDNADGAQSTGKFNGSWEAGQKLAQALDGFLMVVGADGKLIYVSEAASLHLGLSQVEMTGQPIVEYLHQDDHNELVSLINYYKAQLLSVHNQQDFRIPVSVVLRMKCVLAKRNAGIVHGGMKVIHCVGYIRSIPSPPPAQSSPPGWSSSQRHMPGGFVDFNMGSTSPSPPTNGMPLSLGNGIFIEDQRTNDDERDVQGGCRTSSSAGSGGARVPSPHVSCTSPPLPSFAPFAIFLVGCSVPPASATELRLASSSLFMLRTTLDMKLLFVETPRVTELLGYEPQDLIEKNLYNLIHCDDLRTFRACHQLLLIKGQCVTSYYRVLTRDGGWVWVQSVQTIVSNSRSSRPHCIVSVNHVISSQDQHIFPSTMYPAASFMPRRSPVLQLSMSSVPEECKTIPVLPTPALGDLQMRQHQLLIPSPRSLAPTSTTLVKPSPVPAALSAFQPQPQEAAAFRTSSFSGFAALTQTPTAATTPKITSGQQQSQILPDDTGNRSLVPTAWQQRGLVPSTNGGFIDTSAVVQQMPSPFQQGRTYQGYHMGGFSTTNTPSAADFFPGDGMYSFFNKSQMGSSVESYASLFNTSTPNEFAAPMTPMTPMTPASTPLSVAGSRFGSAETSACLQASSQQSSATPNGQANSLQLVGGIHAHTINYTLHIENFNASATSNAGAMNSSTTNNNSTTTNTSAATNGSSSELTVLGTSNGGSGEQQSSSATMRQSHLHSEVVIDRNGSCLSKKQQSQSSQQTTNGLTASESVASAVASATAGLVLGSAPTTIVMCGGGGSSQQQSQQQVPPPSSNSSCWFSAQQEQQQQSSMQQQNNNYFSSSTSGWHVVNGNQQSSQQLANNRPSNLLMSTSLQPMKMNGHHHHNGSGGGGGHHLGGAGLKRPFTSSPFSPTPGGVITNAGVSVIHSMVPQPPNGVIEPLAKRITTAPTSTAWLNTLQQQP